MRLFAENILNENIHFTRILTMEMLNIRTLGKNFQNRTFSQSSNT